MSDILAMYIDMELRASKRPTEELSQVTTRIICCLYVYLGLYFVNIHFYFSFFIREGLEVFVCLFVFFFYRKVH